MPTLCIASAYAAGLGQLRVQSSLGKPLHADIPLLGSDIGHIVGTCIKAKLVSADGAFIAAPRIHLADAPQAPAIVLSTAKMINEPAATLTVEIACGSGIRRDYQILLDPPILAAVEVQEPIARAMPLKKREKRNTSTAFAGDDSAGAEQEKTRRVRTPMAPVALVQTQAQTPRAKSRKPLQKPVRDVLRLSGDRAVAAEDSLKLTISTVLSAPVGLRNDNAHELEPARDAQTGIGAMPRDEAKRDASTEATAIRLQAMQTKIQALEAAKSS